MLGMVDDELLKSAAVSAVRRSGEAAGSLPRSASVGWCRLTGLSPFWKALMVSALETVR